MEVVSSLWVNTQFTLERFPHVLRLKSFDRKIFRPSVPVSIENDLYEVKTADSPDEITQALSLRFEVFFREFSTRKISFSLFPYDIDMHDFLCDHLIVKEKVSGKVVACYRLLADNQDKKVKKFYSEGEFELDEFLESPGVKLELGRACVHKDYRKGTVIALLWRGLLEYAKKVDARYMFGCSSINRKDFANVPHILGWLKMNNALVENFHIGVKPKYHTLNYKDLELQTELPVGETPATKALGSLMHMYVMAGAKMGKSFAYDQEMDCLDMLTIIDLREMPSSFKKRFSL